MEVDSPSSHFVTNIVMLNVYVFCLSMVDGIEGEGDGSLIVAFERDGGMFLQGHGYYYFLLLVLKVCLDLSCTCASFHNFNLGVLIVWQ